MLAADKDRLIAGVKQNALQLRQKELEYFVERYSNLATQGSILAGFAFDSLVELDISDAMDKALVDSGFQWIESVYYVAGSCTMAFALYTVCVASFACVYGHRLALQGPTGSVERAVAVMMKSRTAIFVSFSCAIISLIIAASAMSWIKMGVAAGVVTGVFGFLLLCLVAKHQQMKYAFMIEPERMVHGDVRLHVGATDVDIATLEVGFGGMEQRFSCQGGAPAPAAQSGAGVGAEGAGGGAGARLQPLLSPGAGLARAV